MLLDRRLFGPGPSNPYPEATAALGLPLLGHLDPAFLDADGRDLRHAAAGVGHDQRPDPAHLGHGVGGHGGGVRQHRPSRATSWWSRSTGCSASGCATSPLAAAPRWSRSSTSGAQPVDVERVLCRPPERRRSSPRSTPRPRPASAPTSRRSARPRATRCWSSTPSPASAASSCSPTTGGSTSATPAPRSASAWPPAWRRSRSTTGRSSAGSRGRSRGTSTSACSVGTSARPAPRSGGRTYHHTAPVAMVASLHGGLTRILDEGLESGLGAARGGRGACSRTACEEMGLELFAAKGHRLPELTTVKVPRGGRLGRRPPLPPRAARHRDRCRRRRVRQPPCGGSG